MNLLAVLIQARRQGGFEGVQVNPPFWPPKDFIHCLAIHFLSALPFASGSLASLPFQTSFVAAIYAWII